MTQDPVRLMKLGSLEELRVRFRKLENRASGIISSIQVQTFLAPMSSPLSLDAQKLSDFAGEYQEVFEEGRKLRDAIAKLEDELGV
jgi:hypothetical protein